MASRTASMVRASSPPDAALASGCRGSPGLAPSRKVTWSAGPSPSTAMANRAEGMASVRRVVSIWPARPGRGLAPGRGHLGLGLGQHGARPPRSPRRARRPAAPRRRCRPAAPVAVSAKASTSSSVVAVLALELVEAAGGGPGPRRAVGGRRPRSPPRSRSSVARSDRSAMAARTRAVRPAPAGRGRPAPADASASRSRALASSGPDTAARAAAAAWRWRGRGRQPVLFGLEAAVLVAVLDGRRRRSRRSGSGGGRPRGPARGRRRPGRPARRSAGAVRRGPTRAARGRCGRRRRGPGAGPPCGPGTGAGAGRGARSSPPAASARRRWWPCGRRSRPWSDRPADHRPGQQQVSVPGVIRRTVRRTARLDDGLVGPGPDHGGSARPPSSRLRASTSRVLPAPVSPVSAVMPGPRATVTSSMTPRLRTRSSTSVAHLLVPTGRPGGTWPGGWRGSPAVPNGHQPGRLVALPALDGRSRARGWPR